MSLEAIEHITTKRILFSPLNWGLGHVSRSIPILEKFLSQGNEIVLACDERQEKIYREYFSAIKFIRWEGYPFRFSGNGNFALDVLKSIPKLIAFGKKEKEFVKLICQIEGIDLVVSDHRYFLRSSVVKSIFITHQLTLSLPWYLKIAQKIHLKWLNSFSEVWLLDDEKHSFAGDLSRGEIKVEKRYIGAVSRFSNKKKSAKAGTVILISGPEPYAKQFYTEEFRKLKSGDKIVYEGKIETRDSTKDLTWRELDEILLGVKKIVSRSGYSTIMDIHYLDCECELNPTKGQWEQEYLRNLVNEKHE
jgi:hypothetical protein